MKNHIIFTSLLILAALTPLIAQSPHAFSYQAVVRDATGFVIPSQDVSLKISILTGSVEGTPVYIETHSTQTNQFGLINLQIGNGTKVSGDFSIIDWGSYSYFLKVEMDETGGTDYKHMGTTQLLSVPYALYAEKTGNVDDADADPQNELITNVILDGATLKIVDAGGENPVDLSSLKDGTGTDDQNLIITGDVLTIEDGLGSVDLSKYIKDEDADTTNELQSLTLNGNELSISKRNKVILFGMVDLDADSTNELQILSISNDTIYLTSGGFVKLPAESDPAWSSVIVNYYTKTNLQTSGQSQLNWNNLTSKPTTLNGYGITDAMNTSHAANGITAANISNWNTAYGWGNHAGLYRPINYVPAWNEITSNPFTFASPSANQTIKYNGITSKWENWTPNFLTTEVDGSVTNEIQNLESVLAQGNSANSDINDVGTLTCTSGINLLNQSPLRLRSGSNIGFFNQSDVLVGTMQGGQDVSSQIDVCLPGGMIWWDNNRTDSKMGLWGSPGNAILYVNGKVGIGTQTPQWTLDVNGQVGIGTQLYVNGQVGIGTQTPNYTLDVRGTIGNNTTLYHSDIRWKKDIINIRDPIDKVMQLQGVYFKWRSDDYPEMKFDEQTHLGFIAQDLEEVIPEVVHIDQEGFKNIEYANLIPLLVEAIKDQQKKIQELEKLIKE